MTDHYDAIVIGAGSAGSVVTRRLTDAGLRVLLLEAGGPDTNPMIHDMVGMGSLWHGPEDWDYYTVPQSHAGGRRLHLPRGKVLGGSHSLNAAIWVRGAAEDYDGWEADGCAGWAWKDVLPIYQAIENYDGGPGATRGVGGPLDII
ncbi:MAG: GMC family oxidoreductase N-terminal domain-containing protein, partial [Microbacterium sp.]